MLNYFNKKKFSDVEKYLKKNIEGIKLKHYPEEKMIVFWWKSFVVGKFNYQIFNTTQNIIFLKQATRMIKAIKKIYSDKKTIKNIKSLEQFKK